MTTMQLAFLVDPLNDDLTDGEVAAVEARVQDDDRERGRYAPRARTCRCANPWGDVRDRRCCRCGRTVEAPQ